MSEGYVSCRVMQVCVKLYRMVLYAYVMVSYVVSCVLCVVLGDVIVVWVSVYYA